MERSDLIVADSRLSMNRMARMADTLDPMGSPSAWRYILDWNVKYTLWRVTVSRSWMLRLVRCDIGEWILLMALLIASSTGMDVYNETTSRLQGYGCGILVVVFPDSMQLISSRLFSRWAGTSLSMDPGQ